jgi:hypothetical protein
MKKILVFGLTALSTFALMGCDMITGLFEKSYNYNDFKALLADRKLSFKATKATAEIDKDGDKSTINYTYKDGEWKYKSTILSAEVELTETLDVVSDAKACEVAAALVDKNVDELFKFYAKGDAYRITAEYKTDDEQIKLLRNINAMLEGVNLESDIREAVHGLEFMANDREVARMVKKYANA